MLPHHLLKIFLVEALEESDPQGKFLPLSTRHHATQQARQNLLPSEHDSPNSSFPFLQKRAEAIWAFLSQSYPTLTHTGSRLTPHVSPWMVAIPALVVGLLINGLGTSQRVNLLNFPLLLLIGWNVGTYVSTAVLRIMRPSTTRTWLDMPAHWLSKLTSRWETQAVPGLEGLNAPAARWMQNSTHRFLAICWQETRHLWIQRLRQFLHLGAAGMALGIVLGLYIRGLALDYQATWESTFLSSNHVHAILHSLLGPAAWLMGSTFPTVSDITNLQAPQHGPAATWIHQWAVTALAIIVIPRSLLAWVGHQSLKRDQETFALPIHKPYFVHLLAPDRGRGMHVVIMPYSYQPSARAKALLETGFLDLFGNLATLHWQPAVPFGHDAPAWPENTNSVQTIVVIFNAGQTPEWEVQGEWLHLLQTKLHTAQPGSRLLVMLDEEPYRQIVDHTRMAERRQAWRRLSDQYHLTLVPFDVDTSSADQLLQEAQAGLWPVQG